jgi:hypothetical protein
MQAAFHQCLAAPGTAQRDCLCGRIEIVLGFDQFKAGYVYLRFRGDGLDCPPGPDQYWNDELLRGRFSGSEQGDVAEREHDCSRDCFEFMALADQALENMVFHPD